jgi:GT2 family glycosyltransferase
VTAAQEPNGISVVTPTRGRPQLVFRLLESLEAAGRRVSCPWETIVVDDSSAREARTIAALCTEHGAVYLAGPRRVGAKRNLGARAARFELLLFLDSDCAADPELLAAHLEAHRRSDADVAAIAGPTLMSGEPFGHWRVVDELERYNPPYTWPLEYERVLWCATSNLSVRKAAFEQVGGFDEQTSTVVGGEDADFGVRLTNEGLGVGTSTEGVVHHARELPNLRSVARRLSTYGVADKDLCVKYPERTEWYLNPAGAAVAASLGVLAGTRRPARSLGALTAAAFLLAAGETARRALRARSFSRLGRRLLATAVDASYEAGALWGATRRGRPDLIFRRFEYVSGEFVERPGLRSGR